MAAQVASWMEVNGFLTQAIRWLNSLPTAIQTQTPVRLALVDCHLNSANWTALRTLTASGDWGKLIICGWRFCLVPGPNSASQ